MQAISDLLLPIAGGNPSGRNIRYTPVWDQIKEARRHEEDLPQGVWCRERKEANWPLVINLCTQTLARDSKDLQIAAWLTEAKLCKEGFPGLKDGLDLLRGLIENFWDTVYPELEEGDSGLRASPLDWLCDRLGDRLNRVPITCDGLDLLDYKTSRTVDHEKNSVRAGVRATPVAEGNPSAGAFDAAFDRTPKTYYQQRFEQLNGCLESLQLLADSCASRFQDQAINFVPLRSDLEQARQTISVLVQKKCQLEPEPLDTMPSACIDPSSAWKTAEALLVGTSGSRSDRVHFTLTAPHTVAPNSAIVLLVWMHLASQRSRVIERARQELSNPCILVRTKGPIHLDRGALLTIRLKVPGFLIEDQEDVLLWDGEIGCASFVATIPPRFESSSAPGTAFVYLNGLQIAKIKFVLTIGTPCAAGAITTTEVLHRKAFVSYAEADRDEVLPRLQGIQKAASDLDIFFDVLSLRSGQSWESQLWTVIPKSDIFYLFWSVNASKSIWVEKEWRCALHERGLGFIDPVPLEPADEAPPPPELACLHFNDWMLAFMRRKRWLATEESSVISQQTQ